MKREEIEQGKKEEEKWQEGRGLLPPSRLSCQDGDESSWERANWHQKGLLTRKAKEKIGGDLRSFESQANVACQSAKKKERENMTNGHQKKLPPKCGCCH
jgi:hypothetical protein